MGSAKRAGGAGERGAGNRAAHQGARGALALVLLACLSTCQRPAFAHDWYPYECCSNRDCYAVPASDVRAVPGGWWIDGFKVLYAEARPSPDRQFHICRRDDGKGDLIRLQGKPACVWAPVEGS